jgi:hypothetical protein
MPEWVSFHRFRSSQIAGYFFSVSLERLCNKFLGAESNRQSQAEDDSPKKDTKGKLNNPWSNSQVLQSHGNSEHDYKPFHSNAEETGVLEVQVDGANEHASGKKPSDDVPAQQDQESSQNIGDVNEDTLHEQIAPFEIERGNSYKKSPDNNQTRQ